MNFFWDIVLRAEEQGKKEADLFFVQAEEYSPFYEQSFPCVNETEVIGNVIELNLLYRFADIFQEILSPELAEELAEADNDYSEFRTYLIDAALHALLYTDLRTGLTKRDVYIKKLIEELLDGRFWKAAAPQFALTPHSRQNRLATLLLTQMQTGSSLLIFRRALLVLFPQARLYQMKGQQEQLLLYLEQKPAEANKQGLQFVQDMFLPIRYQLRVFWEYHFGVIGVDDTMRIDEIALY